MTRVVVPFPLLAFVWVGLGCAGTGGAQAGGAPSYLKWVLAGAAVLGVLLVTGGLLLGTTMRRRTAALRESEARYRAIVGAFDGLVYICSQDYRVEFMNQRLIERTGRDATGEPCYEVLHDRESVCPWCVNERVFRGETVRWEVQSPKDRRWYYVVNTPIHHADGTMSKQAMILDITDRKQAEEELRREASFRRTLIDASPAFFVAIGADGKTLLMNQSMLSALGYTREEVEGADYLTTFVPEGEREALAKVFWRLVQDKAPTANENHVLTRDGRELLVEWHGRPVLRPDGAVDYFFGVGIDITERRRAEEELRRHRERLEELVEERTAELQKANEELERFAYSVSHDLRAPLRAMEGFSEALLEDYGDPLGDEGRDYARSIAEAARRMDTLILDLLAYSRIGRTEMHLAPTSLEQVVEETRMQLAAEVQARQAQVVVEEPLPQVVGHHGTLVQVLVNLVSNGMKFVAPGVLPRVRVRAERRDEVVRLWVEDAGIGIAPEAQDRIFGAFERLHGADAYPGTGLGLAIVRRGVERMGGKVGVESEPGKGSRFWVELPSARETP